MKNAIVLLAALLALSGCQTGRITAQANGNYDAFAAALDRMRRDQKIPGMSAAIAEHGEVVWSQGFGVADITTGAPVTATTSFHAASLTKAWATVILLRLVERGVVSLDDPVSKYGVSAPSPGVVRVRHLLSMTSEGTPGEAYRYSGDRFGLLAGVIRSATGLTVAQLVVDSIIKPLGLEHTAPNIGSPAAFRASGLDSAAFAANLAKGYVVKDGKVSPTEYPTYFGPSAGLITTAVDYARFTIALNAGQLLSPAGMQLMFTPTISSRGGTLPYAMGLFSQQYDGLRVVWAYGYWVGNSSLVIMLPDRGVTFVLMANTDQLSAPYNLGGGKLLESRAARLFLDWVR